MAKRNKEDKKKAKRKVAAKVRKEKKNNKTYSLFHYEGDFPYDMKIALRRTLKKAPPPEDWSSLKDMNEMFSSMSAMMEGCPDHDSFDRYFPQYTMRFKIQDSHIVFFPYKLRRLILGDQDCFFFPEEVKLPTCTGHQIVFAKHALERLAERYWKDESVEPAARALHFPLMLRSFSKSEFEVTRIGDDMYLHSFGYVDESDGITRCRCHFPIVYRGKYAVAKTFLHDEWLGSTVTN